MRKSLIIILIPTIIFTIIAFIVGGSSLVSRGFSISMHIGIQSAFMLLASFVLVGQIQVLITKEIINKWLQRFSGLKGIIIGAIAGGLFPGGPYIYYPFIRGFEGKGLPFYILVTFIFGKGVYDFSRIPMEMSLIDSRITLIRNLITLPIPIIVGMLAKRVYQNRTIENIFLKAGENDVSDDRDS